MSDVMIQAVNVGKRYRIGVRKTNHKRLGYALADMAKAPLKRLRAVSRGQAPRDVSAEIWALRNVSFELRQGEVLGIVGRNGAGKSTLLKILSRITDPTEGYIDITGRVGSLLEVGTGFHGELTGRENVYLNGAILGMKRHEIDRKFDEIVDFAQVEKFIDTPIKHFSSGMTIRLAFAVAAHLEPEILIIDEVLAVGDVEFQRKCLGKIGDVAREGRTVLFVSHNMSAVTTLCTRAILLEYGAVALEGSVKDIVDRYMTGTNTVGEIIPNSSDRPFELTRIALMNNGSVSTTFTNSEVLTVHIEGYAKEAIPGGQVLFDVLNASNVCLFSSSNLDVTGEKAALQQGQHIFECEVPLNLLLAGQYNIRVATSNPQARHRLKYHEPLVFEVIDDSSPISKLKQKRNGLIEIVLPWNTQMERQH